MARLAPGDLVYFEVEEIAVVSTPYGLCHKMKRTRVKARLVSFEPVSFGQAVVKTMDGVKCVLESCSVHKLLPPAN